MLYVLYVLYVFYVLYVCVVCMYVCMYEVNNDEYFLPQ